MTKAQMLRQLTLFPACPTWFCSCRLCSTSLAWVLYCSTCCFVSSSLSCKPARQTDWKHVAWFKQVITTLLQQYILYQYLHSNRLCLWVVLTGWYTTTLTAHGEIHIQPQNINRLKARNNTFLLISNELLTCLIYHKYFERFLWQCIM